MLLIGKIQPARLHLILAVVFILAWLNSVNPVLRFNNENANLIFRSIILLFPLIMVINGFRFKTLWAKIINAVVLFLPMMLCLLLALFAISWLTGGVDFRRQLIDTVNADAYKVKVTRGGGSAVSVAVVKLQQEKNIGLGLLLVKEVYSSNVHTEDLKIISLNGDTLEFFDVYGKKKVIALKPNIYF